MELGTLGSILKYAINLETILINFSKDVVNNSQEQNIISLFQDLSKKHEKIVKRLKRVRRENTTEMILEPIIDFESDDYLLEKLEGIKDPEQKDYCYKLMPREAVFKFSARYQEPFLAKVQEVNL